MYADLARFEAATSRLLELSRKRLVRFPISPESGVSIQFEPDGEAAKPEPGEGLYMDLEDAIDAVLASVPVAEFVAIRNKPRPGFATPDPEEVSATKYGAVERLVADAGIREGAVVLLTSKLPALTHHAWEVVHRVADSSSASEVQEVEYAIVRLTLQQASFVAPGAESDAPAFTVDRNGLDYLLRSLGRARDALERDDG